MRDEPATRRPAAEPRAACRHSSPIATAVNRCRRPHVYVDRATRQPAISPAALRAALLPLHESA